MLRKTSPCIAFGGLLEFIEGLLRRLASPWGDTISVGDLESRVQPPASLLTLDNLTDECSLGYQLRIGILSDLSLILLPRTLQVGSSYGT